MSVPYLGDYNTTETVVIPFNTFSSDDPSESVTVTDLAQGDIEIHKDGHVDQRNDDTGVAVVINFDSVTGNHLVTIDLSDNSHDGFYANGSRYQVRLAGITVDGGILSAWIGTFSIGCTIRPTTAGRTLDILATGEVAANLTMILGTAQRATDLAEIAQYLFANSVALTSIIDDNSVWARLLAISGDISAYDGDTESLEAIRNAIVDSNPQNHSATANNESGNTTLDGGTYANTTADNSSYYQTGPGVAVGGFGLDCDLTFNIGTGRVPSAVIVDGKFSSGAQRTVQVWAYDYILSAYVQISNSATDFGNSASDSTQLYLMNENWVQVSDGEIKIRFTSTSETGADVWNCDLVRVSSVAQEAAGLTADAIQQAVWAAPDSGHDHNTLGHALASMFIVDALVVSVTSASQFIINTGIANNDAFNGSLVQVRDETDGHHETRRIVDYIGGTKEVFLDRALSFTPVADDVVHIMGTYADVNVTHVGATEQTEGDIIDAVEDVRGRVDDNFDELGHVRDDYTALNLALLRYTMLMVRKDAAVKADAAAYLTAINTNLGSGGGSYDNETDSQQAARDKLTDIDTKTTNLPTDPADASVIAAALTTIAEYIDTEVQAIKDKTDNLPGSPAAVGSEMTLEDDAITNAKYDESTAFPVAKVDSGDTEIARTGADGDTLEDLSDEIAAQVAGGGSETWEFTLTEDGSDEPVADANVWVTADEAGEGTVIISGFTDTLGVVTFYLDVGTYYFWAEKSGWNFSNPYETEVS